jgi:hypothetical protein
MKWKLVLAVLFCTVLLIDRAIAQDDVESENVQSDDDVAYSDPEVDSETDPVPVDHEEEQSTNDTIDTAENEDTVDVDDNVEVDTVNKNVKKSSRKGKYSNYDDYYFAGIDDASDMTYNWNGESLG